MGRFVVLEGIDGSGKSTCARALVDYYNSIGVPTKLFSFPNRTTKIGQLIDDHLKGRKNYDPRTLNLLFSANRWEMQAELRTTLEQGINVMCDRYTYSGLLYMIGRGSEYPSNLAALESIEKWCSKCDEGLIKADLTIWIDVSPTLAATRRNRDYAETDENLEFQQRLYEIHNDHLFLNPYSMVIIDGSMSTENVMEVLKNTIKRGAPAPL
jgi:dTMP kinase